MPIPIRFIKEKNPVPKNGTLDNRIATEIAKFRRSREKLGITDFCRVRQRFKYSQIRRCEDDTGSDDVSMAQCSAQSDSREDV